MDGITARMTGEILVRSLVIFGVLFTGVGYMTLVERKVSGWMQDRIGPNRVGPRGLLQPLADGIKHLMKEDVTPPGAHPVLFILAPMLALIPAVLSMCLIPFAAAPINLQDLGLPWDWQVAPWIADLNVGLLILLGLASLEVYGVVMAGWSSGSKYSVLGGLRSSAQMISYELALGLAVLPVVLTTSSLRLHEIAAAQGGTWFGFLPRWNVFIHPFGFLFLLIGVFAETKRLPFDLPEAEPELVAGYHTEYSAMKFVMFYMAEYSAMITNSALLVVLFFGGWQLPGLHLPQPWMTLASAAVFLLKTGFFLFLFVWVRWTLPRFRYDQLMHLGWKVLLELAFINVIGVAMLVAAGVL
ncbi:MAG: NADH-quinone oxidoreductase subunit NuoH [Acidobacteriota bacterium]